MPSVCLLPGAEEPSTLCLLFPKPAYLLIIFVPDFCFINSYSMEQSSFPLPYPLPVFLSQGLFSFYKQIVFKLKSSGPWLCSVIPKWLSCPGWWTVELQWSCVLPPWLSVCAKLELSPHRRLKGTSGRQQHFVSAQTLLLGLQCWLYKV